MNTPGGHSFWTNDPAEVEKLVGAAYNPIENKDVKDGDLVVLRDRQGKAQHSMILTSAKTTTFRGQVVIDPTSTVKTKNGIMPLAATDKYGATALGYARSAGIVSIKAYRLKN